MLKMKNFDPRVLVATAAANTGIDNERVDYVLRVGLPRCIITLLQERGRNVRNESMVGLFAVFTDWTLFIQLILSILLPTSKKVTMVKEHNFANSMILSCLLVRALQSIS